MQSVRCRVISPQVTYATRSLAARSLISHLPRNTICSIRPPLRHGGHVPLRDVPPAPPATPHDMARKRSAKPKAADVVLTADRAGRLVRILKLLGRGPQKR